MEPGLQRDPGLEFMQRVCSPYSFDSSDAGTRRCRGVSQSIASVCDVFSQVAMYKRPRVPWIPISAFITLCFGWICDEDQGVLFVIAH